MTAESNGPSDLPEGSGVDASGEGLDASARRERALVKHESEVKLREAAFAASETRAGDMREANQRLVFATLAAENLEEPHAIQSVNKTNFLPCWPTNCATRWRPFGARSQCSNGSKGMIPA